jgi:hypothetical protein
MDSWFDRGAQPSMRLAFSFVAFFVLDLPHRRINSRDSIPALRYLVDGKENLVD